MALSFINGHVVDAFTGQARPRRIVIQNGRIAALEEITPDQAGTHFLLPGFVDAHVHVESSMLVPSEFARLAVIHGTVATVSDPHEIANVLGVAGVRYMVENARTVPLKITFGAPSCVPATTFETAGAVVSPHDIDQLFSENLCHYLSEVMNFPGVLTRDPDMVAKLAVAKKHGKPIDGHAPGMRGDTCSRYFCDDTAIRTDHECTYLAEALDKIACGCNILIREGSAAKNYEALCSLIMTHPEKTMLCSDDKHPDDLVQGHINELATRALERGVPLLNVLRVACINPVLHYRLPVGLLRVGDPADFIETDSLTDFRTPHILRTVINGNVVAERGKSLITTTLAREINAFSAAKCAASSLAVSARGNRLRVIEAEDGQLLTRVRYEHATVRAGRTEADVERDILKIAVVNRYTPGSKPAVAFIHGFGLKRGALASSVAHDSHNIVAVGTTDAELARAINAVIANQGGLAVVSGEKIESLPLPVAGLMSTAQGEDVATAYGELQIMAKETLESTLTSPFMTLSFMALLVIPALKLSDRGLFDGATFQFVDVFE